MNPVLIAIRLSRGALKSSDKNVITVFLLTVLPSFCIWETIRCLSSRDFRGNYWKIFRFERLSSSRNSHLWFGWLIFLTYVWKRCIFLQFYWLNSQHMTEINVNLSTSARSSSESFLKCIGTMSYFYPHCFQIFFKATRNFSRFS